MKTSFLFLLFSLIAATANGSSPFEGRWRATVPGPRGDAEMTYIFTETDGKISGVVESPFGVIPMGNLSATGDSVFFLIDFWGNAAYYSGTIKDESIEFLLDGARGETRVVATRAPASFEGKWRGTVEGPDGSMELIFTFRNIEGVLSGSVSSDFGETPFETGSISGDTIKFATRFEGMPIEHTGTIDGDSISLRAVSSEWEVAMTLHRM
jgi:hypothetical protein